MNNRDFQPSNEAVQMLQAFQKVWEGEGFDTLPDLYQGYQLHAEDKWHWIALGGGSVPDTAELETICASTFQNGKDDKSKRLEAHFISEGVWIDVDSKNSIDEAIKATRRLVQKFIDAGADPDQIHFWASGGKGFHLILPWGMFLSRGLESLSLDALQCLPDLVKEIAYQFYVECVDLAVYNRGRMWRRENVARSKDGRFKVRVTWAEVQSMTEDVYLELVSALRTDVAMPTPSQYVEDLAFAYVKAKNKAVPKHKSKFKVATRKVDLTSDEEERIVSALESIDAQGVDYQEWRNIAMAVHHSYQGSDQGLEVFERWSQFEEYREANRGKARQSPQDLWDALEPDDSGIKVATLYKKAKESGWTDPHPELNPKHNPQINETAIPINNTPVAFVDLIAQKARDKLMYVSEMKCWYAWNGKIWKKDLSGHNAHKFIKAEIKALRGNLYQNYRAAIDALPEDAADKVKKDHEKRLSDGLKFVNGLETAGGLAGVESLLSKELPEMTHDQLDAHPFLLNVQNGVLDLRTKELRPHDPCLLMSRIAKASWNPDAKCPEFQKFLAVTFFDDLELMEFIQRAYGYSLSGDISLQKSFWQQGGGSNGKSTINTVMRGVLGSYVQSIPSTVLLSGRKTAGSKPSPELLRIPGARILLVSELDTDAALSEAAFKDLVSTDLLTARDVHSGRLVEVRPQCKFWPAVNGVFIKSTQDAVWRRIVSIPFDRQYDGKDSARKIFGMEDKLQSETNGVLTWAVEGFQKLWNNPEREHKGFVLNEPEICRRRKSEFRGSQDVVGMFIDECLVKDDPSTKFEDIGVMPARLVYAVFQKFVRKMGHKDQPSEKKFSDRMGNHGIEKKRRSAGQVYLGWKVLDSWLDAEIREVTAMDPERWSARSGEGSIPTPRELARASLEEGGQEPQHIM